MMRLLLATMMAIPAISIADDAKLEACREKLKAAHKLGVLYDMKWVGTRLHVVAGKTYYNMPFDAKEGFADTINCFAMAGGSGCLTFEIKHWQTGRATEEYHYCKLKPK